jgi:hypothetical protein
MPEQETPSQDATTTGAQDVQTVDSLPEWAQKIIKDTREESKQRRIALENAEKEKQRLENERLQEQGKYKEISEKQAAELTPLKVQAERAALLETAITENNDKRVSRIPETHRGLVPADYTPEKLSKWLDANEALLIKPTAPQTDAGAQGTPTNNAPKLNAEEQTYARMAGMSDEEYLKFKTKP